MDFSNVKTTLRTNILVDKKYILNLCKYDYLMRLTQDEINELINVIVLNDKLPNDAGCLELLIENEHVDDDILEVIITEIIDPNQRCLTQAIKHDRHKITSLLIDKIGCDINNLHIFVQKTNYDMIKYIFENKKFYNLNKVDAKELFRFVVLYSQDTDGKRIFELFTKIYNMSSEDLEQCYRLENNYCIRILEKRGIRLDKNNLDEILLAIVNKYNVKLTFVKRILKMGGKFNNTCFKAACIVHNYHIIQYMLDNGFKPDEECIESMCANMKRRSAMIMARFRES
jgi:hypothetical protein